MKKPLIISAPQAAGKTRNAQLLMKKFGCSRLVDEWDGRSALRDGDLALTNMPVSDIAHGRYRVLSLESALA